jgi:NAD(P)-dependent dehydrogenase (short-subunit alcohol dehydrogenase family)
MANNLFSLDGKTIVVTGASSGIGRQCAISCSQLEAIVVLIGRKEERLDETLKLMENKTRHLMYSVDLTQFELIEDIVKNIVLKLGKINGLINCAGISTTLPFNMVKPEIVEEFFNTNVQTAINITRILIKQSNFSEEGGSIVFLSSVMGEVGEVGKSIYSITKGALIAGSKSLALELAPRKIRVNCISPGIVETPMSKGAVYSRNEESLNKIKALHPLGLGQPEDIANACVYLLSDASRWITGTNLIVDGGYLAR